MNEELINLGRNIKLYRKSRGYTLEQFAKRIYKSKSLVSKYENGQIAINILTLLDICSVLNVELHQLVSPKFQEGKKEVFSSPKNSFFKSKQLYMYYFDGRINKLCRGILTLSSSPLERDTEATLYLGFDSFDNFTSCEYLYWGKFFEADLVSYFILENQNSNIEKMSLSVINPMNTTSKTVGLSCGVASNFLIPGAFKFALSKAPLEEDDNFLASLKFSKEDLAILKKSNMLLVRRDGL